ncbi:hypothetical protein [Thermoleptolyngbya sp. M55_K2018_002]|uniref:hypothetical protein n=1 Tax=Thermoleptolyngbya sp. M55_K2018_002 TaxID=2747808 RepID=UPI0019F1469B|nr:hypothetical protein [Thermoleptolyngbya sp. M55_K2018_002]HIK39517.1 hypothetical protein [Thermoleptolyngbya sp. M55_K2018_002]
MNTQEADESSLSPSEGFTRVALLTSYPLYWRTNNRDATDHAQAVHKLIQVFLDIPGASLGVSGEGKSWNWLDPEAAQQWNDEMQREFEDYAVQLQTASSESRFRDAFNKRQCMFFAPLYPQNFLAALKKHFDETLRGEQLCLYIEQILSSIDWSSCSIFWSLSFVEFTVSQNRLIYNPILALWRSYPTGGYWAPPPSNDLQSQPDAVPNLSVDEASFLLQDVMWNKLETVFAKIRSFCGLGIAQPEFAKDCEAISPIFYFAQYVDSPSCAEELASKKSDSLYPLVKTCLGSDDPFAKEVSGGVLEGDFLTLRRARISKDVHHPRYLIFPLLRGKLFTEQELERDLYFIAHQLSYLEFSIAHELRLISTDYEPLLSRQARWGGTLDGLSDLINNATSFLPTISGGLLKKVYLEMEKLSLPLRQVQSSLEKVSSDVAQIKRTFDGYRDGTEDFWDRNLTYSSCQDAHLNDLREALLDAYPYHYWKQPLQSLKEWDEQLLGSVGRSVETVNSMLQQADRMTQESLEVWTRRLGIIAALAAPVLALPNFIDLKLDSTSLPQTLFGKVFHEVQDLQTVIGYLLSLALAALFVASAAFLVSLLWGLVSKKKSEQFVAGIRSFKNLVERSNFSLGDYRKLDQLDTEACQILSSLWIEAQGLQTFGNQRSFVDWLLNAENALKKRLRIVRLRSRRSGSPLHWLAVKGLSIWLWCLMKVEHCLDQSESREIYDWLRRSRRFRYLVYLFDLMPTYIPLPRALCIYRYKARDLISRTTISDWDFEKSLINADFPPYMITSLKKWLQDLDDAGELGVSISVDCFVDCLEERGVRSHPDPSVVEKWQGSLS